MAVLTQSRQVQVTIVSDDSLGAQSLSQAVSNCGNVSVSVVGQGSADLAKTGQADFFLLCPPAEFRVRDLHRICERLKQVSRRSVILLVAPPEQARRFGVGSLIDGIVVQPVNEATIRVTFEHFAHLGQFL